MSASAFKSPSNVKSAAFSTLTRPASNRALAMDPEARTILAVLDGVVAQPRPGREIGAPIAGALFWLHELKQSGFNVGVFDDQRPITSVSAWLKLHSPTINGERVPLEEFVQVCTKRPRDAIFIDATTIPFNGSDYPTPETIGNFNPWWNILPAD